MPNYIDRDNLLQLFRDSYCGCKVEIAKGRNELDTAFTGYNSCISLTENIPTADVQEDVEGEWIRMNDKEVKCSRCSLIRNITTQEGWRFCPSCGVLMLEDE